MTWEFMYNQTIKFGLHPPLLLYKNYYTDLKINKDILEFYTIQSLY